MTTQTGPKTSSQTTARRLGSLGEHDRAERVGVVAAGEELRAGGLRLLDPLGDPRARVGVDHRPDVGRLVRRVADGQRLDLRQEALEEAVEGGLLDVDPLDGDAALAGEGEGVRGELRRGEVEVGVGGDDDGCRVAELQLGRACGPRAPAMPQPTPLEPVNVIILTRSSSTSTSPISAGGADEDVEPAGREASLLLELGEQERRERRLRSPA